MFEADERAFAEFFSALWGRPPFAWQRELARRVLADEEAGTGWPEAIALPTAAGKTACLDIAIFALAAQADRLDAGLPLTAPRRIFFVVDRRVIVDEAFERARELAKRLEGATNGILKAAADRLRRLSGTATPLACHQLRGGMYRSDAWAHSPLQPAVIATTVDQLGSRLLFRAYGRGFKAWPIQAGLAGNDCLILLDEAHCAQPFLDTLQAVRRYRAWAETPLPSPFQLVVMSATPPAELERFEDISGEPRDPRHPLGKRMLASKPARLEVAEGAKGNDRDKASQALAEKLAEYALELGASTAGAPVRDLLGRPVDRQPDLFDQLAPSCLATVVFCNRVETARRVHALLKGTHGDNAILLTGRMRPIDKDDTLTDRLKPLAAERAANRVLAAPLFVVATQTLEVGANLDFDRLVTEAASLDALRQRFGRLNRMGRDCHAEAVVVIREDQAEKSDDDPVYGVALANTWKRLAEWADRGGRVDFGVAKLAPRIDRLADEDLALLNAPTAHAPILLPAYLDAWVQTAPEPWPSPDLAPFLHGPKSGPADVQVCWRADLTGDDRVACIYAVGLCPPSSPETLAVPIGQFRRWLAGEAAEAGADVEGTNPDGEEPADPKKRAGGDAVPRWVIRWRGMEDSKAVSDPRAIQPGDLVVIPAQFEGWRELATLASDHPVADWGDRASIQSRDKALLRLHPEVISQWPEMEPLLPFAGLSQEAFDADSEGHIEGLRNALKAIAENPDSFLTIAARHFAGQRRLDKLLLPHPVTGWALVGRERLDQYDNEVDSFSDEDDPSASSAFRLRTLDDHLEGVGQLAARFARGCGLPEEVAEAVTMAGRGHDLGKADPRFQAWLKGGNRWARGALLAKSAEMAQGRRESEAARERAGYPPGGRHELVSVRLLESRPDLLPAESDLLLHLVGSHHGHCRPFAPVVEDGESKPVRYADYAIPITATGLERLDSGVAERFWRLTRRYGWWGLAWLEAITRLADHRRSEAEERERGSDGA